MGPLPAGVYWRRRWVAVASTFIAVLTIVWTVAALLAPVEPDPTMVQEQASSSAGTPAAPTPDPTTDPTPDPTPDPAVVAPPPQPAQIAPALLPPAAPRPTTTPPNRHPIGQVATPPAPTVPAGPPAAPAVDPTTTEQLRPDDTVRRTGPAPTPVPVPATGPVPCTNAMLGVGAEVVPPTHRVTDRPVLRLVVTNISAQPCVRDLDAARQEIVVWGMDGSRLWSSNDCSTVAGVDLRTLVPGQPVVFAVTWAGRTSSPGCPTRRSTVPAGSYNVLTRVDDVISPPATMTRV